jgi:cold-inducible RNA-binding protein
MAVRRDGAPGATLCDTALRLGCRRHAIPPVVGRVASRCERFRGRRRRAIPAKIFVGNLSFGTSQEALRLLCEPFGEVRDVFVAKDRATGKSRGFAFVEMSSAAEANEAIRQLNGREVDGRALRVNAAEERSARPAGQGRGFGGGFGGHDGGAGRDAGGFGADPWVATFGSGGRPGRPKGSRRNLRASKRSL